tara:strand:+ start:3905 stop:4891 length:987 start_codon:yes stop_codon:yes gene_type:complete
MARRRVKDVSLANTLSAVESILRGACGMVEGALSTEEHAVMEEVSALDVVSSSIGICVPPDGFTLRLSYGENLPKVRAQAYRLQQLFNNLLTNAVRAMEDGGTLSVRLEREWPDRREADSPFLRIIVEDEGPGVPVENRDRIFGAGFSTREGGSGLGLAAARAWLEEVGGEISLDPACTTGARFIVRLPAIDVIDPRTKPMSTLAQGVAGRALVLDDDPMVLQILIEMLEYLGWEVVSYSDGRDIVRRYRDDQQRGDPFDLVILDLTVPQGLGGAETGGILRELDPNVRMYISSGWEEGIMSDPGLHGFSGSLKKPYTLEELSQILTR